MHVFSMILLFNIAFQPQSLQIYLDGKRLSQFYYIDITMYYNIESAYTANHTNKIVFQQ